MIQAILFKKPYYNLEKVKQYITNNNLKPMKEPHETENFYRVRMINPNKFKHFMIKMKNDNIKYVIGY